ncbi:type II toxin-antitoxin system CcdA family antitoxin [Agrobacterium larrymoorei]|uniref:type II toxin-antitoxin system CcdA family antitoxin n=1 Tax=Agrobacterium larrymoorei TaxID=160699 RepID=UPI001573C525|nr:type II toxin-antitoxin system CcdA family antitoxin [Agrobacterium larrymoorei]NTJ41065.1 type II toxin-antitoxin system CcdA family antitoxin [Agrobacterium larrymoorei]
MPSSARKAANLSLDGALVEQAKELKINISRAVEEGISHAIKAEAERERLWSLENAEAIWQSNEYVEKHGLPLARYRTF